ncbi:Uncharacterised protein [Enterobacter cloacae]|nr:Uncharacterised protein [Enterobacter cloacae]
MRQRIFRSVMTFWRNWQEKPKNRPVNNLYARLVRAFFCYKKARCTCTGRIQKIGENCLNILNNIHVNYG